MPPPCVRAVTAASPRAGNWEGETYLSRPVQGCTWRGCRDERTLHPYCHQVITRMSPADGDELVTDGQPWAGNSWPMRPGVVVGVHAHAEPARLVETVRSLQGGGEDGAGIVLLPDGPDAELAAALTTEPDAGQSSAMGNRGAAGTARLFQPAGFRQRRGGRGSRRERHGARAGMPATAGGGARRAGAGARRPLHQPLVERAGRVQPRGRVGRGPDRRAGPSALRHGGALAGAAAQPGGLLPGRRAPGHRGDRRRRRGVRPRALLGNGLQHPGRPGRLPGGVGRRRLRLPPPAYGAAPCRRSPADGPGPPPLPGPFLRPAAQPAASGLRGPLPG